MRNSYVLGTFVAFVAGLICAGPASADNFRILYSFTGGSDGKGPVGPLALSGSTLFGMTRFGGSSTYQDGVVFKLNVGGAGFNVLHTFLGAEGARPDDGLTISGGTLYGATSYGGDDAYGVVFKCNADGGNYSVLHSFNDFSLGIRPVGSPVISGSTVYGMTEWNGEFNQAPMAPGSVFKLNTDGTGITGLGYAGVPAGSLTLSGSCLYWLDLLGTSGSIDRINTDGTGFTEIHVFHSGADGASPNGSLTLSGSVLYGTTNEGGSTGNGVIFMVNTDGSGYTILHNFGADAGDGKRPRSSLTLAGTTLYGTTYSGGSNNKGTLFKINADGGGYATLCSLGGTTPDIDGPLILSGSTLYGVSPDGGAAGMGAICAFNIPEPGSVAFLALGALGLLRRNRNKR